MLGTLCPCSDQSDRGVPTWHGLRSDSVCTDRMRWTKGYKEKTLHEANWYAIPDLCVTDVENSRWWAHACGRYGEQGLSDPTGAKTLGTTTKVRMGIAIN